jgi:hypothetical protein
MPSKLLVAAAVASVVGPTRQCHCAHHTATGGDSESEQPRPGAEDRRPRRPPSQAGPSRWAPLAVPTERGGGRPLPVVDLPLQFFFLPWEGGKSHFSAAGDEQTKIESNLKFKIGLK